MVTGRLQRKRAQLRLETDTRPGQVLLLSILAAAPIAVAFILLPLAMGATHRYAILASLVATPILAAWSLVVLVRAPVEARAHNASRIGFFVDLATLLLWVLVLIPALMGRV